MFCGTCGQETTDEFCAACGAKNEQWDGQVAAPAKKKGGLVRILVPALLGLFVIGSVAGGIVSNNNANSAAARAATAVQARNVADQNVTKFEGLVSSYESLLITDRAYKTQCYYNVWCSVDTYTGWINLVNSLESRQSDAQASADQWQQTSNLQSTIVSVERTANENALKARTGFFVAAGVFAAGLIAFFVVTAVRRKKS